MTATYRSAAFKRLMLLAPILIVSGCGEDPIPTKWETYMPASGYAVGEILRVQESPHIKAIVDRVQDARSRDPVWFKGYARAHARDKSLPHEANLGLTKRELEIYFNRSEHTRLVKDDETALVFKSVEPGKVKLTGVLGPDGPIEFVYDDKADTVHTPMGVLKAAGTLDQNNPKHAMGRWRGYIWNLHRDRGTKNSVRVTVGIGRLKDRPKGVLYYYIVTQGTGEMEEFLRVLTWDVQKT